MNNASQGELEFRSWGGRRAGAGRPQKPDAGASHAPRPGLARCPVHVTLRVCDHVWNLRSRRSLRVVEQALSGVLARPGFRVVHFSLQGDHVHLLVEADGARELACGMKALSIRLSKGMNRMMGSTGPVLEDRYHAHVLRTPREVRNALSYVLLNHRSHLAWNGERGGSGGPDPFSSSSAFDGWRTPVVPAARTSMVTAVPRSWLLAVGWRRHGLISPDEIPALR